jgi:hypothetical protein
MVPYVNEYEAPPTVSVSRPRIRSRSTRQTTITALNTADRAYPDTAVGARTYACRSPRSCTLSEAARELRSMPLGRIGRRRVRARRSGGSPDIPPGGLHRTTTTPSTTATTTAAAAALLAHRRRREGLRARIRSKSRAAAAATAAEPRRSGHLEPRSNPRVARERCRDCGASTPPVAAAALTVAALATPFARMPNRGVPAAATPPSSILLLRWRPTPVSGPSRIVFPRAAAAAARFQPLLQWTTAQQLVERQRRRIGMLPSAPLRTHRYSWVTRRTLPTPITAATTAGGGNAAPQWRRCRRRNVSPSDTFPLPQALTQVIARERSLTVRLPRLLPRLGSRGGGGLVASVCGGCTDLIP